jgi:hypothetical protein
VRASTPRVQRLQYAERRVAWPMRMAARLLNFPMPHWFGLFFGRNLRERGIVRTSTPRVQRLQYAERRVAWPMRMAARLLNFAQDMLGLA